MTDSLFHEVHGTYFTIVRTILSKQQTLTVKELECLIKEQGFDETAFQLLPSLTNQRTPWYLLKEETMGHWSPITQNKTPLINTNIERRWLKTLINDPRLLFFLDKAEIAELQQQLIHVEPLFDLEAVTYYDQFNQVDSLVEQKQQHAHFKQLLAAINAKQPVKIEYQRRPNIPSKKALFLPVKLEYSQKNNLFRLRAWRLLRNSRFEVTLNLNRMLTVHSAKATRKYLELPITARRRQAQMTCILVDKRKALERSMLHFADYNKSTQRLDDTRYQLTIHYDLGDETELLIRLLSFGPFITVTSPTEFVAKIKERVDAQAQLLDNF